MLKKQKQAAAPSVAPKGVADAGSAGPAAQEVAMDQEAPAPAGLFGSSVQPSVLNIGGRDVQLGEVVQAAFVASELSVEEWNALAADVRESLIADEVSELVSVAAASATPLGDDVSAAAEVAQRPDFPRQVTLRNHGGFAVTEPSTSAFVGAGSSVIVTVHDEAQAVRLLQNISSIKLSTGGRQSLVVSGLNDVAIPQGENP